MWQVGYLMVKAHNDNVRCRNEGSHVNDCGGHFAVETSVRQSKGRNRTQVLGLREDVHNSQQETAERVRITPRQVLCSCQTLPGWRLGKEVIRSDANH